MGKDHQESSHRASLTFDDGPDPVWTPRVLDALHQADARATFFVMAPLALRYPDLVHAVREAGHEVQLHCTRHIRHTLLSREELEADTRNGVRALESLGIGPRLWRPPWGVFAPWTKPVAARFGLETVRWTADTHDWRGDTAPEMLESVGPLLGPDAVVLMHDGLGPGALREGCDATVALIGPLVARLRSLGCEPAPLEPNPGEGSDGLVVRESGVGSRESGKAGDAPLRAEDKSTVFGTTSRKQETVA